MSQNIIVAIIVAAAVLYVVRRIRKTAKGEGGCGCGCNGCSANKKCASEQLTIMTKNDD